MQPISYAQSGCAILPTSPNLWPTTFFFFPKSGFEIFGVPVDDEQ